MVGGLIAAMGDNDAAAGIGGLALLLVSLAFIPLSIAVGLIQLPLMLRSGMTGDVGEAFQFNWAFDFLKRCWLEMILVTLLTMVISIPLAIFGVITCCIGFIPVAGYMALASSWFNFQLYRVYLSKGGTPVPLALQFAPATKIPTI